MRNFSVLILLLLAPAWISAAEVEGMRLWAGPDATRVVFDLDRSAEHTIFTLKNPDRIVIDISNTRLAAGTIPAPNGVVRNIRHAPRNGKDLRVVLDLALPVEPKSFLLKPHENYGYRLVVDLENPGRQPPAPVKQPPQGRTRDVIVAIDAGHGGEDPGAIGHRGTREKDVVLSIARRLAALIEREPGMKPVLIREGDYYISLRDRIKLARQHRADMFISIHADAFRDKRAYGSSVYVLSQRGASSEAAAWLAGRENAADLVGGVKLDDKDGLLASVLLDLSQTATISASLQAAGYVLGGLDGVSRLHRRDVQQAGFVVLKSPDVPSLLVETAFISNPEEEQKLRDTAYQQKLAQAVHTGVREYFRHNAPPDTLIAAWQRGGGREHIIARGDTLSGIAQRYRVSVQALRAVNGLQGDLLRVGDTLRIPANYES